MGLKNPAIRLWLKHRCKQGGCSLLFEGEKLEVRKGSSSILLSPKQFIHIPGIAARFGFYFDPLEPSSRNGQMTVDFSSPRLQTYRRSGLQFEMPSWAEEEEAIESYFRWYEPERGDLVFDIGAHCGVSAYFFSQKVGSAGSVIAFEPDPLNFSLLLRNIERHKLTNVKAVQVAIAGRNGTAAFQAEGTIGSALLSLSSAATGSNIATVQTITLADAYERWGVPAFCKIDIEGAEIEVLNAARTVLPGHPTQYALDTTHIVNNAPTAGRVEQIFKDCGLQTATDSTAGTTWAGPKAPSSQR